MFLRRFTRTTDGKTQTLVEDSRPSMLPRRLSHYLRSKPTTKQLLRHVATIGRRVRSGNL